MSTSPPDGPQGPSDPSRDIDPSQSASELIERLRGGSGTFSPGPTPDPSSGSSGIMERFRGRPSDEAPRQEAFDPGDRAAEAVDGLRGKALEDSEGQKARKSFWRELPVLVLIALVVAVVIKTFLVQAFFIESGSMRSTLLEGDRVMVNKLSYRLGDIEQGDVVVFDPPGPQAEDGESFIQAVFRNIGESIGIVQPSSEFIKRVVATGGQTIEIRSNQVFIDGELLDEPYVQQGSVMADFGPVSIPEGHIFVMGDNRNQSRDSRFFGSIPEADVIGKAFVRVWPPSRWGGL